MKVVIGCNVVVAAGIDGVCREVTDVAVRRHETVAGRPEHANATL
jgi:hypothetical protein